MFHSSNLRVLENDKQRQILPGGGAGRGRGAQQEIARLAARDGVSQKPPRGPRAFVLLRAGERQRVHGAGVCSRLGGAESAVRHAVSIRHSLSLH